MYAFTVTLVGDDREGSVVSPPCPIPGRDSMYVVIMWDDDYTFEVHSVEMLQARAASPQQKDAPNVLQFPGGPDETTH